MVPLGAIFGAIIGGCLASYGRRLSLILTDIFSLIGIGMSVFAIFNKKLTLFLISRIIAGINAGSNETLILIYNKEMAPDAITRKTDNHNIKP